MAPWLVARGSRLANTSRTSRWGHGKVCKWGTDGRTVFADDARTKLLAELHDDKTWTGLPVRVASSGFPSSSPSLEVLDYQHGQWRRNRADPYIQEGPNSIPSKSGETSTAKRESWKKRHWAITTTVSMTQRYRGTEQEASDNRVSHLPYCRDLLCALLCAS